MTVLDDRADDLERENAELRRRLTEREAELAEREAEVAEALNQRTATADVLGVINSSPGDLAAVFDAILEKAHTLCGVTHGGLVTYDGEHFRLVAERGMPAPFAELVRQPFPARGARQRLVDGAAFVHVADVAAREPADLNDPIPRASDEAGFRTLLMVPLRKDNKLLGYITAHRMEVRPFSDKQIALLQNFAAQAVIAMENTRLITETRETLEHQTATAEVLGVINSSPGDLTPVFAAILEKAHTLCDAPLGSLVLYDGENLRGAATRGYPSECAKLVHEGGPASLVPAFEELLRGERAVHVPDAAAHPLSMSTPIARATVEIAGARTLLLVPLRKDGTLLGYISAQRQEVEPFSEKQIALLENFAAQAVIAMENARLIAETREALEQQTATAEVLQVINSSPGDLAPVFDVILEKAHNLCGAAFGILNTFEGGRFHAAAMRSVPAAFAEFRTHNPSGLGAGTAPAQIIAGDNVVHNLDLMDEDAYRNGDPNRRAIVDLGGVRSHLAVALRKDAELLGYISAFRKEVRPFTDKQIALLQNFAQQAVIAMENARLLGELRQRTVEVAELNRGLEARVAEQVEELGRVGRLKRFLAPQLAELIVSQGDEAMLQSHRREIVVVFCDLRGFTAFAETAEPEEVLHLLREYHAALGPLVSQFEGTLDHFSGDGIMVFFNDPVPCPDPAERAVKMSVAMRTAASELIAGWRRRGRELGFGVGIAQGYATLGQIGFADRSDYTAIGTVCNVAARLCGEAKDGQILLGRRVAAAVEETVALEEMGSFTLKGLLQPVAVFNVPTATAEIIPLQQRGHQPL